MCDSDSKVIKRNTSEESSSSGSSNIIKSKISAKIRDRSPIRPIMANPMQNYHVNAIPTYDGDQANLAIFITACESLLNTFADRNEPARNEWLLRIIIGKLEGRARALIGTRDVTRWQEVKDILLQYFSDQRDEDCLARDMLTMRPDNRESPYQFGMRIQDVRSLLRTKLKLNTPDLNVRNIKNELYDKQALQTFLHGLHGNLGLAVRMQRPNNLERAMSLVIEEENFEYAEKQLRNLSISRNNSKPNRGSYNRPNTSGNHFNHVRHSAPLPPQNDFYFRSPNYNNFTPNYNPNFNSHFNNFNQQGYNASRSFPQNNYRYNNQQHPNYARNSMPNQQRQAGANYDVFKPNPNYRHTYKPTPMDTSSVNSVRRPRNSFQANSRPQNRWVAEELHYQEVEPPARQYENVNRAEQAPDDGTNFQADLNLRPLT